MRKFFAIGVIAMFASISQAQAETLFRGTLQYTDAQNCPNGPRKGDYENSQFHPRIIGNSDFAAITTISNWGGSQYRLSGKNFTSKFQKAETGGLGWSVYNGTDKPSSVLISGAIPPLNKIKSNTQQVTLQGQIQNPWGDAGAEKCVVTFSASYFRRLN